MYIGTFWGQNSGKNSEMICTEVQTYIFTFDLFYMGLRATLMGPARCTSHICDNSDGDPG